LGSRFPGTALRGVGWRGFITTGSYTGCIIGGPGQRRPADVTVTGSYGA